MASSNMKVGICAIIKKIFSAQAPVWHPAPDSGMDVRMDNSFFRDKVIVITGASDGIGKELALQLAAQGALLSLAARSVEKLEAVAAECRGRGGTVLVVPTDVGLEADCAALVQRTAAEFGRIDVLVNNAGITMWANFEDMRDLGVFEHIMRVNYLGCIYCTHFCLPYLKETKGLVVGVSSLAGKTGVPARSGYAASKHAVTGFLDSLRIEIAGSGVGVTVVYPDFVGTGEHARAFGPDGNPLGTSPVHSSRVMPVEECARQIMDAMAHRRREQVMTFRGKLIQWVKLISPALVDRFALRAIQKGR